MVQFEGMRVHIIWRGTLFSIVTTKCEMSSADSSDVPKECLEYIWILLLLFIVLSLGYEQILPVLKVENCSHSPGDQTAICFKFKKIKLWIESMEHMT